MAYEGQIAGVGDQPPGRRLRGAAIRFMQRRSAAELAERRAAIVAALGEFVELEIVNGGGTGSLELTAAEDGGDRGRPPARASTPPPSSTTTAASASPRRPASRCRSSASPRRGSRPRSAAATSPPAAATPARLPGPWLPPGLELDPEEGAGEVQTPLLGDAAAGLAVGDRAYLRHAKAGELCERFDALHLVEGEEIVDVVPTYRGEGQDFL